MSGHAEGGGTLIDGVEYFVDGTRNETRVEIRVEIRVSSGRKVLAL